MRLSRIDFRACSLSGWPCVARCLTMNSRRDLGMGLPLTVTGLEAGAFCAAVCAQTGVETHRDSAASSRTEFENMAVPCYESEIIAHPARRPEWRARGFRAASAARAPRRPCGVA